MTGGEERRSFPNLRSPFTVLDVRRAAALFRHRAKHELGRRPRLYHWVYRLRDGYADRLVTGATDLCIEGFPRSANSFTVGAFEYAQDEDLTIAKTAKERH